MTKPRQSKKVPKVKNEKEKKEKKEREKKERKEKKSAPSAAKSPNEVDDCEDPTFDIPPDAILLGYPSESMNLPLDLEGALREMEKEITDVLEKRSILCDIPIRKTASISKKLANELLDRNRNGDVRIDHLIESIIKKDYEDTQEPTYESERDFRQDLIKYIIFATGQFTHSSIGSALKAVEDLHANDGKVLEYEIGCPVKCASTVFEYYKLTKDKFESLNESAQLNMKKHYIEEVLRYQRDMQSFLNIKFKKLRESKNRDDVRKCLEAAEALEKNHEMGIVMKREYDYIANKENVESGVFRDSFRSLSLKEEVGARPQEEEMEVDRQFASTPAHILKLIDGKKARKIEFDVPDFPTTMGTADDDHSVVPRPTIDHMANLT